ncbi:MAG: regulatory protein RecX [Actinomycetota bacterium]
MATFRRPHESKNPLPLHDRALGLLAVRPRSRREIQMRLLRAGFPAEEVDEELGRLESVGLLDDELFATEFAEHEVGRRGAGRRAVARSLSAKGVDRETIERVLAEVGGNEEERAAGLAADRARGLSGHPPDVAFRRLVSFLVRRGYKPDLARRASLAALGLDKADERSRPTPFERGT